MIIIFNGLKQKMDQKSVHQKDLGKLYFLRENIEGNNSQIPPGSIPIQQMKKIFPDDSADISVIEENQNFYQDNGLNISFGNEKQNEENVFENESYVNNSISQMSDENGYNLFSESSQEELDNFYNPIISYHKYRENEKIRRLKGSNNFIKKWKKEKCHYWETYGYCKYGDQCAFAHEPEQKLKREIPKKEKCSNFEKYGICLLGLSCPFSHEPEQILSQEIPKKSLNKEFDTLLKTLDNEDDNFQQSSQNLIVKEKIKENEKTRKKKDENIFKKNSEFNDYNEIKDNKIRQISINSFRENKNSSINQSTGESFSKNSLNISVLISHKHPFSVIHLQEDLISSDMKLNMSSCNLYCKIKKKRVRNEVKKFKQNKKAEDMEKPLLRQFKKYLAQNKDKKEFQEIFKRDEEFWDKFIYLKKEPFKYTKNGKEFVFNSFNQDLMEFVFSKNDVNILYEKFISDKSYREQKKVKKKDKCENDKLAYEIYLKNFNKIYNPNYKEKDLVLD